MPTLQNVLRPRGERPSGGSVGPADAYGKPKPVAGQSPAAPVVPIRRNGTTRGPQQIEQLTSGSENYWEF